MSESKDKGIWEELLRDERQIVEILYHSSSPKGARIVARELLSRGFNISEATVSRFFARLDKHNITVAVSRKGRVLTTEGRALAKRVLLNEKRGAELDSALQVHKVEQLVDLLRARRGFEREAVMLAAERATTNDIAALERTLAEHQRLLATGGDARAVANEFHRKIIEATHSNLFQTLSDAVLHDALESLDPILFVITTDHGTLDESPREHLRLINAIKNREPTEALEILEGHLTRLIDEVEAFQQRDIEGVFERLLKLRVTPSDQT